MFDEWSGEPFATAQFALQVVDNAEIDDDFAAAAFDGKRGVLLRAREVGVFLLKHLKCELLVYDAARVHWNLHRRLSSPRQPEAIEALWSFSRRCRLLDVMVLDQRIRVILECCYAMPKKLHQLIDHYCVQESDVELAGLASSRLCGEAEAIFRVYNTIKSSDDFSWLADRPATQWGLLGIGIDVQGAIGVSQQDAHLVIDHVTRRQIVDTCESRYATSSRLLYDDTLTRKCFRWDGTIVARDKKGYPRWNQKLLRKRLAETLDQFRDLHGRPFMSPRNDRGQLSLSPEHWEPFTGCVPRLKAWADLTDSAALIGYFQSNDQDSFRPKYRVVPYLHIYAPPLKALKRFGLPVLQPVKVHYCRATLVALELRCLAATFGRYSENSRLSLLFHDQREFGDLDDVREVLAGEIRDRFLNKEPLHETLPLEDRDDWIGIINVALFAIPRGLAAQQVRILLEEQVEGRDFSAVEYGRLQELILSVLQELVALFPDKTIDDVCEHLKIDPMALYREIDSRSSYLQTAETAMLNFIFGRTESQMIRDALLAVLPPDSQFRKNIEDDSCSLDEQLLWRWPMTPSGQIGLPAFGSQSRSAEFQQRVDEVVKRVAYDLVAEGFELCAINGDEFILHVEGDDEETRRKISSILTSAAESVVPDIHFNCRLFVD